MVEEEDSINILIYGLGAVGCFYGFILKCTSAVRLTVVARSNYEIVKHRGFTIRSENHGEHTVRPDNVVKTTAEAAGRFDFVVCTAKALDQSTVARDLKPVIDDDTTIVIIQNGVGNEDAFRASYPNCSILSAVTWVWATQTAPGLVEHWKSEKMEIGTFPNPLLPAHIENERLETFASLLVAGKTPCDVESKIQTKRWEKIVWNVAWNSLTALTMLDTQSWLGSSEESMPLTRRVMKEAIEVAHACGIQISHAYADQLIAKTVAMPGIQSSMMTDCKFGRQMEVEVILGTPVRKAKEHGIPVPTLDTLYALLVAVNYRMKRSI